VANQTITFPNPGNKTFGDPDFDLTATASSGLPVTYTVGVSDDCTVSGNTVHITGAGSCTITAHQAGNDSYNPAPDVSRTITIAKAGQTITFPPLATVRYGSGNVDLNATSSSGLAVSYLVTSGDCTIVGGDKVHANSAGVCRIDAYQHGNANYKVALDVNRKLTIAKASTTTVVTTDPVVAFDSTMTVDATVSGAGGPVNTGHVQFYIGKTLKDTESIQNDGTAEGQFQAPHTQGKITVHAVYVPPASGGNWTKSTSKNVPVRVV
jgi:hypothetical protein